MIDDVYEMLVNDILESVYVTEDQCWSIVHHLMNENLIDYDTLKEHYFYGDED